MLFQPAIIALLLAAAVAVLMLAAAAPFAWAVLREWDIGSGAARQLELERRTYLFSTLVSFVMAIQLAALLLFVFNADRLAVMFVGAMCAVGTLNVNEWGFPALIVQMLVFFSALVWLAINHVDNLARDYPLVRAKYALLLLLLPLLALNLWLQYRYFSGLRANVITSCCGSLFSEEAETLTAEVSSLEPRAALWLFYVGMGVAVASGLLHWRRRGRLDGGWLGIAAIAAFAIALSGVISFVSLYIYEHPHHHCPFCILKPEYDYRGYALYLPLFGGAAAGMAAGALQCFAGVPSLRGVLPRVSARLALLSALGFLAFTLLATWFVIHSKLILIES